MITKQVKPLLKIRNHFRLHKCLRLCALHD